MKKVREFGKVNGGLMVIILIAGFLSWGIHEVIWADNASELDYHTDVREAVAIADASSGICAEVDANGYLRVSIATADVNLAAITAAVEIMDDWDLLEDAAHTSGDEGLMMLAVRLDTAAALCGATSDYTPLITDSTGQLYVVEASGSNMATDLAAIELINTDIETALQIIDDWDDGDFCNVNINIAGTDVAGNSGNKDAQCQRVVIATDDINQAAINTAVTVVELAYDVEGGSVIYGGVLIQGDDGTDRKNVAVDASTGNVQVDISTDQPLTAAVDSVTSTPKAGTGVVVVTNDAVVKASAGTLYAVMVSFDGVTVGDTVEIENHATADSGTSLCTFVAQAADENLAFQPCVGIAYAAGIYCDYTLTGGAATVTLVYE